MRKVSKKTTTGETMKKMFATIAGVAALVFVFNARPALAGDKEVTVKGDAKCAMCSLHEGNACTSVIQTKKDGKTVNYYVVDNDVSKELAKVSHNDKKVVAKGTVKEVDGKQQLTLTKVEVAKN